MSPRSIFFAALLSGALASAQYGRGGGDWLDAGGDAQRSSSIRTDAHLSVEAARNGGIQFQWKQKLNGVPSPAVVASRLITYKGFKDLMFVATNNDVVYSIDHPFPKIFWEKHMPYNSLEVQAKTATATCPVGMTSSLALMAAIATPPSANAGRGRGPAPAMAPAAPVPTLPRPRRTPATVYAVSSDGLLHVLNQHTGEDVVPAARFVRANAKVRDVMWVNNVIYAATVDNCGGAPNGVWALDLADNMVYEYKTGDSMVVGMAIGGDGTVYATTGQGILALEQKTLKLKSQRDGSYVTAPTVFKIGEKEYIAAGNEHGHVLVLDTKLELTGNAPGAGKPSNLATWEDPDKVRWIVAAKGNSIQAYKANESGALEAAWTSKEIISPSAPIIINGVVFALASGSRAAPAVLYALNIADGKELWSSGKTITGYSTTALSAGANKVYVGTHDGVLYAFGYTLPRD
jgi:outer membrane protein assembly factor BamB